MKVRSESDAGVVAERPVARTHASSIDETGLAARKSSTSSATPSSPTAPSQNGLYVVYGSRTRRGLHHANEDRHAVVTWPNWGPGSTQDNLQEETRTLKSLNVPLAVPVEPPKASVLAPPCTGSGRRDTTCVGVGATGDLDISEGSSLDFLTRGFSPSGSLPPTSAAATSPFTGTRQRAYMWQICDGHDGPQAADYSCANLGDILSKAWHDALLQKRKECKGLSPLEKEEKKKKISENCALALSTSLARSFETLDHQFRQAVSTPGPLRNCTAGACVTAVVLIRDLMCCAGLGDCKAAILTLENGGVGAPVDPATDGKIAQQFQITWFSKEHRSSDAKERARIKAKGGWFVRGRVGGVLEPTRTIGDFDVKDSQPPGVVIATPEVRTYTVDRPALVVIASDGVWDVMDASQLLKTLKQKKRLWRGVLSWLGAPLVEKKRFSFRRRARSKEGIDLQFPMPTGGDLVAMADTLVTRAHDLGSDDDCTCFVVFLRPAEKKKDKTRDVRLETQVEGDEEPVEADLDLKGRPVIDEEEEEEDEDEELDEEEAYEEEVPPQAPGAAEAGMKRVESNYADYEKWRLSDAELSSVEKDDMDKEVDKLPIKDEPAANMLSTACFPLSFIPQIADMDSLFPSNAVDKEDPVLAELTRKRAEERRARVERSRSRKQLAGMESGGSGAEPPRPVAGSPQMTAMPPPSARPAAKALPTLTTAAADPATRRGSDATKSKSIKSPRS